MYVHSETHKLFVLPLGMVLSCGSLLVFFSMGLVVEDIERSGSQMDVDFAISLLLRKENHAMNN